MADKAGFGRLRQGALVLGLAALSAADAGAMAPPELDAPRSKVAPLFDAPVRDTSICKGGDGAWYLTGTVASAGDRSDSSDRKGPSDFQNNDGVWLWRSTDLKEWKEMGQVWSIAKQATGPKSAWQKEMRVNPDDPAGPLVRGMVSPEAHYRKDTYWITYSMNGQGTGLLRSTTGKPEGPYEDLGQFTAEGTDASIFVDDANGGAAYWVMGQGWMARLKDDLSGLAEAPRLLRCAPFPSIPHGGHEPMDSTHAPRYAGTAGAFLFKANNRYWLMAAAVRDRIGVGCYDTFVAGSDKLEGPYTEPLVAVPHGGQTTVFQGPGDAWFATFSGRDSRAAIRDKPAIVPLEFGLENTYGKRPPAPLPYIKPGAFTEFGPWDKLKVVAPYHIRDLQCSMAPDGFTYLTGSGTDKAYAGRIMVFRSKDMRAWEPVDIQFDFMSIPGVTEEDRKARFDDPKQQSSLGAKYMDSEIYFVGGTFHIFTSLYGGPKKADGSQAWGGTMWLRSKTGKPEGPYEYVDRSRAQNTAFVDDDGKTYIFYNGTLEEWDPKGAKMEGGKRITLRTEMGTAFAKGDVATNLLKIHGKYMVFATGWCGGTYGENYRVDGTYDWVYWQSDKLEGPYEMPRRAYAMPHAGHSCPPLQGPDGRWFGLLFGNESTGPWPNYPGVLVYDIRKDPDDTVRIEIKDELP